MEAIRSSEMSGATQWTTWHHIPEDDTLHNHRCENLKSYKLYIRLIFERRRVRILLPTFKYCTARKQMNVRRREPLPSNAKEGCEESSVVSENRGAWEADNGRGLRP
jgi:hypothetical protein